MNPKSKVFLNNLSVGESEDNGWLLLEGIQSGNHRLKISDQGFAKKVSIFTDSSNIYWNFGFIVTYFYRWRWFIYVRLDWRD